MPFAWLHRYPFLRLLCPLIAGIYCGDELIFQGQSDWVASCVFPLFFLFFGALLLLYFQKSYSLRWIFGVILFFFCFVLGAARVGRQLQLAEYTFPKLETTYRMTLTDTPRIKAKTVSCKVLLTGQIDSMSRKAKLNHIALIYLNRDSLSESLCWGDELLVYAKLSPPRNNGNPDEFDYARYLLRQRVSAIGFANGGTWKRISKDATPSFHQKLLGYRERILSVYRRLGFQGDDFAVLSALTVGYKEELSEEIRESYSVTGSSHVLALSGLHIGFLYAMLWFCLSWLPRNRRSTLLLRTLMIIVFLWGFAFFTGLSASVVRSVTMFSLFALSGLIRRKNFSLNTLFAAAFFMLLVRPFWLYDVGFQLSVSAVAAILLIQPGVYKCLPAIRSRPGEYLRGLVSVSIAAQIGTAPLVLFYFSRFPIHFLLSNLLIIPLVSVILYGAVGMLLLTPFLPIQVMVATGIKSLIGFLNACVRWVEQLPCGSVEGVWLYRWDVVGMYLFMFLLGHYLLYRQKRSLFFCLSCLLLVSTCHAVMQSMDRPRQSIVFYNVRNCPVVHCIASDGRSWLAYADSCPDEARLHKAVSKHWNRLRLERPRPVVANYEDDFFCFRNQILTFGGQRVCMVNNDLWRNKRAAKPLYINHLYICKGYKGSLKELAGIFSFRDVVLDASLADYRRRAYENECKQLGVRFISLSEKGSARFLL